MRIIPHGAAREVTGTCHELQIETAQGPKRILLDCGMFQGRRREAAVKNATFPFDPASAIDAVILTHAHMDHVGRIPLLWKKGYRGPVHCTYASKDLAAVMLQDSGYLQEKDEEYFRKHLASSAIQTDGPLYTQEDAAACMPLFHGHNYGEWVEVVPGVRVMFLDAGHIIGAAMLVFEIEEAVSPVMVRSPATAGRLEPSGSKGLRRIGFSGDLGRSMLPIIRDPSAMPPVEVLICESTYGNRTHESAESAKLRLKEVIMKTSARGGKVIIPAFSLERTQEIVYDLHVLWDAKEIPAIPIVIDSPLASKVTDVFMKHPECYDQSMFDQFLSRQHNPFQFSLVRYTETIEESKDLNGKPGPMVLMAGSGMCEGGRIRHHLKNEIEDARNTILAVGFMAEHTLGRRVVDKDVSEVKIFDELYQKKAEVAHIDVYSGHADMHDLDAFVAPIEGLKSVILVHGETHQMEPFAERLRGRGLTVHLPAREEEIASFQ